MLVWKESYVLSRAEATEWNESALAQNIIPSRSTEWHLGVPVGWHPHSACLHRVATIATAQGWFQNWSGCQAPTNPPNLKLLAIDVIVQPSRSASEVLGHHGA